jgi:beta-glucosidase
MTDQKYTSKYIDVENTPLYPFGYGLSYTDFNYRNLKLSDGKIAASDTLEVTVDVQNTGERGGEEVVQLYIRDLFASLTRPVKELRDFKKVKIEPDQSKTITFTLTKEDFAFYNKDLEKVVEPGKFKIFVGTNSRDVQEAEVIIE